MMTGYAFAVVLCAILIGLLFVLMRRRRLREKYAAIWIVVSAGVVVMAVFPEARLLARRGGSRHHAGKPTVCDRGRCAPGGLHSAEHRGFVTGGRDPDNRRGTCPAPTRSARGTRG